MAGGVPALLWLAAAAFTFAVAAAQVARAEDPTEHVQPTESECRPYIEKALKQLGTAETPPGSLEDAGSTEAETIPSLDDNYQEDAHSIELEGEEGEESEAAQGDEIIPKADEESTEAGESTAQDEGEIESKEPDGKEEHESAEGEKSIEEGGESVGEDEAIEDKSEKSAEEVEEEGEKSKEEEGEKSKEEEGEKSEEGEGEEEEGEEEEGEEGEGEEEEGEEEEGEKEEGEITAEEEGETSAEEEEQSVEGEGEKSIEEEGEKSVEEEGEKSVEEEGEKSVEEESEKSVEEEGGKSADEEDEKSREDKDEKSREDKDEKSKEEGGKTIEDGEVSGEEEGGKSAEEEGGKSVEEEKEKSEEEEGKKSLEEEDEKSREDGSEKGVEVDGEKSGEEEGEKSVEEEDKKSAEEEGEKSIEEEDKKSAEEVDEKSIEEEGEEGEKSEEEVGEKSEEEVGDKSAEEGDESIEEGGEKSAEEGEKSAEEEDIKSMEKEGEKSIEEGEKSVEEAEGEKSVEEEGDKSDEGRKEDEDTTEVHGDSAEEKESAQEQGDSVEQDGDGVEQGESAEEHKDKREVHEESTEGKGESTEQPTSVEVGEESDTGAKTDKAEELDEGIKTASSEVGENDEQAEGSTEEEPPETTPEEELTQEIEIPEDLRPRDHIAQLLHLDDDSAEKELLLEKTVESTLKELKRLYDVAIKPLETVYKYRDLSNRHFGDPEIFSKPLILFMGPWSGGKSSIINYLLDNEYTKTALRTGAEPSPAYFNILMWGDREEIVDGTQLAADWTFSGLQKFGQGLLDRLRGLRLPNKLLEKVNIVEIPGILEIRKQVERLFPFNDACQWFIDRADIIFLVYDPAKLDVGPETEAILDQLKGREYQTRIILNKADQVRPEELMRVQGTLVWNISPLMSSTEPPIMYSVSLWSLPYEQGAPLRLLQAQERAFLRDLREAIEKRVENKIASARRFAVRVRNHAKMVDCYLTTYFNHKSFFGDRKKVSNDIIERPQNYHIYEGLSTLRNISRYDLPDPDVYRDFFRLNALYDFPLLASTCTYFRGCPINRLDVTIAYDLPELVGKYKKAVNEVTGKTKPKS